LQKASVNFLGVDDWNKKSMIQARIFPWFKLIVKDTFTSF
jgi:hypothetical protein